jgi:hypothetical protein
LDNLSREFIKFQEFYRMRNLKYNLIRENLRNTLFVILMIIKLHNFYWISVVHEPTQYCSMNLNFDCFQLILWLSSIWAKSMLRLLNTDEWCYVMYLMRYWFGLHTFYIIMTWWISNSIVCSVFLVKIAINMPKFIL